MPLGFAGSGLPYTEKSVKTAADLLGVDVATILAIAEVETAGCGFLADRRPQILFERHIFHSLTAGLFHAACPAVSAPVSGGYGRCGAFQYQRLALAMQLDEAAALRSTSWGIGQTMGFNAGLVGYDSTLAMIRDFAASEEAQLLAIARFCQKRGLVDELRAQDWTAFAYAYNGPNFSANNYGLRLKASYARLKSGRGPDLRLRTAQVQMMYLGFYRGRIDGVDGPGTNQALTKLQKKYGLPVTGRLDEKTQEKLHDCYTKLISTA
jgi:hypothetical protein